MTFENEREKFIESLTKVQLIVSKRALHGCLQTMFGICHTVREFEMLFYVEEYSYY